MSGADIIKGLKDAIAGNFSSVFIDGQQWVRDDVGVYDRAAVNALSDELARLRHVNAGLVEALEIIAGRRQCIDNLMSNTDVALAALRSATETKDKNDGRMPARPGHTGINENGPATETKG